MRRSQLHHPLPLLFAALTLMAGCAPPTPPTTPTASPPPRLRLPDGVRPLSYRVTLRLDPARTTFSGRVEVEVTLRRPVAVIWLHAAKNLTVRRATLRPTEGAAWSPARTQRAGADFLGVRPARPLAAGRVWLRLAFTGALPKHPGRGLYRQREGQRFYLFTQFEAIQARRAFPCFDEPAFKAPWRLTLEIPAGQRALANTPPQRTRRLPGAPGRVAVTFAETPPLPSYLVAFAVGPFDLVDAGRAGRRGTAVRIAVPQGRSAEAATAKKHIGPILAALEDYFGIPYPYPKCDFVAVPLKSGAMENPGLITFGAEYLLSRPKDESLDFRRRLLGIATHELSHIWLGDLVTMAWWDDLWLNEAFATWMTPKILHRLHPDWPIAEDRVSTREHAMRADSLTHARRIRQPITSPHDIANAFDAITYRKGALVLRMFEQFVGEETFRRGLRAYLERHANGNATARDFAAALSAATSRPDLFGAALFSFLDRPGLPLVQARLRCPKGRAPHLSLRQSRYLPLGSPKRGQPTASWRIPLCVRYPTPQGPRRSCILLADTTGKVPLPGASGCPAWVQPNDGLSGYFRLAVGPDLLTRLERARFAPLGQAERIGLLSDLAAAAWAGKLPLSRVMALLPALLRGAGPRLAAAVALLTRRIRYRMVAPTLRDRFGQLITRWFGARARALGLTPRSGEADSTRRLRRMLVTTVLEATADPVLLGEARRLAATWLDTRKGIAPELVTTVLRLAARRGHRKLFERMVEALRKTRRHHERRILLTALGSFKDEALTRRALAIALEPRFDLRESLRIFWAATGVPAHRDLLWSFLRHHYATFAARLPKGWLASLPGIGGIFCTPKRRRALEAFFRPRIARLPGGPHNLALALEGIRLCGAARQVLRPSLSSYLRALPPQRP